MAAQPILASTLFDLANNTNKSLKRKRVGTACSPIDDALRDGVDWGRITCISGEKGTGKTMISMHLLITHLLSSSTANAAVIDTTGQFDILRLYQAIVSRVTARDATDRPVQAANVNPQIFSVSTSDNQIEVLAEKVLERVKIMRVFDLVGVVEAVNELKDELCSKPADPKPQSGPPTKDQKVEVADSEDEEEEMLFDASEPLEEVIGEGIKGIEPLPPDSEEQMGMIIIDNITQAVNPLLKNNYVQGQSLLTTFLRSLAHLTETNNLATILINAATSPKPNYNSTTSITAVPSSTYIQDPTAPLPSFLDQPSIFASTTARPALGKAFTYHIDLHLLLSTLPKRRRDAQIVFGGKSGRPDLVNVMEVLNDRSNGRTGRWAAFTVDKGIDLKNAF